MKSCGRSIRKCVEKNIRHPIKFFFQLPVEKALAMGYIKASKALPAKIAPIGHGRPPTAATAAGTVGAIARPTRV